MVGDFLEKLQHVDLCGRDIMSDDGSTFLVAEVAEFVITATVALVKPAIEAKSSCGYFRSS